VRMRSCAPALKGKVTAPASSALKTTGKDRRRYDMGASFRGSMALTRARLA